MWTLFNLLMTFCKLFYLRLCFSSDHLKSNEQQRFQRQYKKHFYMRVILILIPTNLVTNWFLSLCFPLVKSKNKNRFFSKLVIFQFLVYSGSRSTSKACLIQQTFAKEFCYMLFCFHYSFMEKLIYQQSNQTLSTRVL